MTDGKLYQRYLPDFDELSFNDTPFLVVDLIIPRADARLPTRHAHYKAATTQLHRLIEAGEVPRNKFTHAQLQEIATKQPKISCLIWYHHQNYGRMQLFPEQVIVDDGVDNLGNNMIQIIGVHYQTRYIGGYVLWFKGITAAVYLQEYLY